MNRRYGALLAFFVGAGMVLIGFLLFGKHNQSENEPLLQNNNTLTVQRLSHRGFMLDTSLLYLNYCLFFTIFVKQTSTFSGGLQNHDCQFHWHMTDNEGFNVQWDYDSMRLTLAGNNGGYYTPANIQSVVSFASTLGIAVIPEFELPGHVLCWNLTYPYLMLPSITTADEFDISNPSLAPILHALYKEMLPQFSDIRVHAAHDETSNSPAEIQKSLQFISSTFAAMGKQPIIWDDPITSKDIAVDKSYTIQVWTDLPCLKTVLSRGYRTIISVAKFWYIGGSSTPADFVWPSPATSLVQGAELVWFTSPSDPTDPAQMGWVRHAILNAGAVMAAQRVPVSG